MMRVLYASLGMGLIILAGFQNMLFLAAVFSIGFTIFFGAVWLFPAAVLIDGYFNAFSGVPMFSLIALVWYVVSELLSLRMRIMK